MIFSFDPKLLTVTLFTAAISHVVTGFADEMLTVEFDFDIYNEDVDIHNNLYRFKTGKDTATARLMLKQGSPTNDVLSNFVNLDKQFGTGVFAFTLADRNSDTLISSIGAYVKTFPTLTFGNTNYDREWGIKISGINGFIGGFKA